MKEKVVLALWLMVGSAVPAFAVCPFNQNCLDNSYGAGSPYIPNGLNNPYSQYGSPDSNKSWNNPYPIYPQSLYDRQGNYRGSLSNNPYDPYSTSNPYGMYGSQYSPDSINNP